MPRPPHAHVITAQQVEHEMLDRSSFARVSRGAFARAAEWDALFAEGRLRTRARAVAARCRTPDAAYSHWTAAALHWLPVYRVRSDRVDMIVPAAHTRKHSTDARRHQLSLPEADVVVIDGLRTTSLDRTIFDVIRAGTVETAVACCDAALRQVAWDDRAHSYDSEAAARFRGRIVERIDANAGARGIRRARFVIAFADGRAQLPGESVARLWMHQLGVAQPVLQRGVDLGAGQNAYLDFAWPDLRRWAEFDGQSKYDDADLRGGRSREQVLADQAERTRRVRRVTGWREDRFGFERMPSIDAFADYLRSVGLLPG